MRGHRGAGHHLRQRPDHRPPAEKPIYAVCGVKDTGNGHPRSRHHGCTIFLPNGNRFTSTTQATPEAADDNARVVSRSGFELKKSNTKLRLENWRVPLKATPQVKTPAARTKGQRRQLSIGTIAYTGGPRLWPGLSSGREKEGRGIGDRGCRWQFVSSIHIGGTSRRASTRPLAPAGGAKRSSGTRGQFRGISEPGSDYYYEPMAPLG